MKKILLLLLLLIQVIFSATPKQVKEFIMVSKSNHDLMDIEQIMYEMLPPKSPKNNKIIRIRFQEYLEKNFTENEIKELIKIYKKPLIQELYTRDYNFQEKELNDFNISLAKHPISSERLELNEKIIKNMFDNEDISILVSGFQNRIIQKLNIEQDNNISKKESKEIANSIRERLKLPILYKTKTMSIDELKEILEIVNIPIFKKSNKTILKATIYALDIFLVNIVNNMMENLKNSLKNTPNEWKNIFIPEMKE